MRERCEQALSLDEELRFQEADVLWKELIKEDTACLEERLRHLIRLQEHTCQDPMTQCRLSMTYHYQAVCTLEKYGNLLGDRRYYYRAYTYVLTADYLSHMDLCECAVDCYFRALIFQTRFPQEDEGHLKIKTMLGILHCYDALHDREMRSGMLEEFEKEIPDMGDKYQKMWEDYRRNMERENEK